MLIDGDLRIADFAFFVVGQHQHFIAAQGIFDAIQKANPIRLIQIARRKHDNANGAARVQNAAALADDIRAKRPPACRRRRSGLDFDGRGLSRRILQIIQCPIEIVGASCAFSNTAICVGEPSTASSGAIGRNRTP